MKLTIEPAIAARYPDLCIGVLVVRELRNGPTSEATSQLLREEEQRIRNDFTKESFTEHPTLQRWRQVYADFGVKPRDAKASIENLYRIVLSGKDIRRVSTLVDLYNAVSLRFVLPLGGEDLDTVKGDIALRFAGEGEPPVLLLGDEVAAAPVPGEVIYADSTSAICRRWNWREADRTKLTMETKNCILVVEALGPAAHSDAGRALEELTALVRDHCGGVTRTALLHAAQLSLELD